MARAGTTVPGPHDSRELRGDPLPWGEAGSWKRSAEQEGNPWKPLWKHDPQHGQTFEMECKCHVRILNRRPNHPVQRRGSWDVELVKDARRLTPCRVSGMPDRGFYVEGQMICRLFLNFETMLIRDQH